MGSKWYTEINKNDILGSIRIHDAKANGFDLTKYYAEFFVVIRPGEPPSTMAHFSIHTYYDEVTDTLVADTKTTPVPSSFLLMFKVKYIRWYKIA